jgi:UDP:flavonoid glycosyltransferase YjiC (YdhE family)
MRVLFATTAGAGHLRPLVPFAHACLRAGHYVLVAGPAGAAPLAERTGLAFRAVPEPTRAAVARFRAGQHGLPAGQAMTRVFTELYIGLYGGAALPGMLAAAEEWRPEVIVRESAEVASAVAADRLRIPHAEVSIALSSSAADRIQPLAEPRIDALRATVGLRPGGRPPLARLTLTPRSLDHPPAPAVHRFRERVPGGRRLRGEPLVYLSFGTEVPSPARHYFPALYRDAIAALGTLPVRTVVTIGDRRDPEELGPLPPSVHVERWLPQAAVLRDAVVTVTHGGAGSTLGALAAGVPLAVLPLFADQPLNARRIAASGAGMVVNDVAQLGGAVRALLRDRRYRDRARRVAAEIRALPPVDEAVDVLASLRSGDGRPRPPRSTRRAREQPA